MVDLIDSPSQCNQSIITADLLFTYFHNIDQQLLQIHIH